MSGVRGALRLAEWQLAAVRRMIEEEAPDAAVMDGLREVRRTMREAALLLAEDEIGQRLRRLGREDAERVARELTRLHPV